MVKLMQKMETKLAFPKKIKKKKIKETFKVAAKIKDQSRWLLQITLKVEGFKQIKVLQNNYYQMKLRLILI